MHIEHGKIILQLEKYVATVRHLAIMKMFMKMSPRTWRELMEPWREMITNRHASSVNSLPQFSILTISALFFKFFCPSHAWSNHASLYGSSPPGTVLSTGLYLTGFLLHTCYVHNTISLPCSILCKALKGSGRHSFERSFETCDLPLPNLDICTLAVGLYHYLLPAA